MNIKGFFTRKKIIWTIIIVLVLVFIGYLIFKPKPNSSILTDTVKRQDLKQTVLATGQVVSKTDLDLSFQASGVVQNVSVSEGDQVKAGQQLGTLDQKNQLAGLTSAKGTLAQAEANYQKVLAGASSQDIAVSEQAVNAAEVSLNNATSSLDIVTNQQQVLVDNAYNALLNSSPAAVANTSNTGSATVTISGSYTSTEQGQYQISLYNTGSGLKFKVSGLENNTGDVKQTSVPLGTRGLFIQFTGTPQTSDGWTVSIPNTQAATYVINYNAYQAALQTQASALSSAQAAVNSAQVALAQAQAALNLKLAQARPADIDAAQAAILSAQGQVQAANAALENTILRAPADGVITQVDVKVGEQATAMKEVLVLQDVNDLHVEADISEANVAGLQNGQPVDLTFDALGPDRHFSGKVQTINPASTVISGVVDYKVTATMDKIDEIKPGMTANMVILTGQKNQVLAVPSRAVVSTNGKNYVRVIDDPKKKTFHQTEVTTGLEADGGLIEITSGLSEGQEIVTYLK